MKNIFGIRRGTFQEQGVSDLAPGTGDTSDRMRQTRGSLPPQTLNSDLEVDDAPASKGKMKLPSIK